MYQEVVYAASKSQSVTMLEVLDMEVQNTTELPKLLREKSGRRPDRDRMAV